MKKIFNVDNFPELKCSETDYWKIVNFFSSFTKEWYQARNIYCERHHIYPKGETETEIEEFVYLPFKYHYLAHYYRALNAENELQLRVNFNACKIMQSKRRCRKRFDLRVIEWNDSFYETRRNQVQKQIIKKEYKKTIKRKANKKTN